MTYSIRTYDAGGNIIIDEATRLMRILGTVTASYNNYVENDGLLTGDPIYCILNTTNNVAPAVSLDFTFSGSRLTWARQGGVTGPWPQTVTFLYGVH